ncbi:hypothetical protein QR680_005219 [Steinernema hermaphroditum]|uniref:Copper transport protein n=1 Tax=Steinernema hermaphroditum TaxID=289476 RepID=A0AA39HTF3_9BILA|nr:hypothetical protein QR680_005219 [Steinernema hermaphroditum]
MDHEHNHGHHNHEMHSTAAPATSTGAHGHGHMDMGHAMAFHFGTKEVILFKFWDVDSTIGILIACMIIVALCFLLESIRWFRVFRRHHRQSAEVADSAVKRLNGFLLADGVLHAVQLTIGYFLMLVFMTFNVWLCVATVLGEVLANLTFRVLFPQLEASAASAATIETCCG